MPRTRDPYLAYIQAQRRAEREAERQRKAEERARIVREKERAKLFTESRIAAVAAKNEQLEDDLDTGKKRGRELRPSPKTIPSRNEV
jgi:hypothetical protein